MKLSTYFMAVVATTASSAWAASMEAPPWVQCASLPHERQLECYDTASQRYLAEQHATQPSAEETISSFDWKLDRMWPEGNEIERSKALAGLLLQYKRNYLMIDSVYAPASAPGSPNPANNVSTADQFTSSETKLQASVKARLPVTWPWGDSIWVAYTQQSHWQAFNGGESRPFRETDYEPEIIFLSHRFGDEVPALGRVTPRLANFAFVHQSNGQSLPRSRSWNRLTAELGSEYRFDNDDGRRFTVLVKPWWRVSRGDKNDDNPDIVKYLGHGEVTLNYWQDRTQYALLLRERAVQLDWSFPLWIKSLNSADLHLQYFNGYGHSLIDYNHKLHSFGIGISLPY